MKLPPKYIPGLFQRAWGGQIGGHGDHPDFLLFLAGRWSWLKQKIRGNLSWENWGAAEEEEEEDGPWG